MESSEKGYGGDLKSTMFALMVKLDIITHF